MKRPSTFDLQLGLTGYPLSHSLSPIIHSAALHACGWEGSYSLFPVPPDDKHGLRDLLSRIRSAELHGLNVTIPHKQNVIPLLDELTPTAKAIGAVNTIYFRENKLIGDNTDAPGFLTDLRNFLGEGLEVKGRSVLVLGAGGSARAVVYALANDGWKVMLTARRIEQAQHLAASFVNYPLQITDFNLLEIELSNISLIVNTTPVGMTPKTDQSPWPQNLPFPPCAAIYDLVYNPRETKLVKDAWSQGLVAATGLGMLIEQAALSFEIWSGHRPSREAMFESIHQNTH
ncbi:MAG TPA: shikimate dehydrogenase [Anaerolineales bacterium]|nr:shikimate dehydrogenase [Anaerolineales bacterium]